MAISELQLQLREFVAEREWQRFQTPKNLVMALTGEAGELTEIFQWLTDEQSARVMGDPAKAEHVRDEIADVLAYLLRLCDVLGVDPEAALAAKITKNAIKYPAAAQLSELSRPRAGCSVRR
jgi:NTP pyrophosphatase (non-canonical NTP hydrolase)